MANLYNSEGYIDLTAYEALRNIEIEKRNEFKKIVFICSPYAGDVEFNIKRAKRYGRFAIIEKVVPIIPHLMYPQILSEDISEERKLGITMGLELLKRCNELWFFGDVISKGMTVEINRAIKLKMPVRHFTVECKPMGGRKLW